MHSSPSVGPSMHMRFIVATVAASPRRSARRAGGGPGGGERAGGRAMVFRTMLIFTGWLNVSGSFKYNIYDSGVHRPIHPPMHPYVIASIHRLICPFIGFSIHRRPTTAGNAEASPRGGHSVGQSGDLPAWRMAGGAAGRFAAGRRAVFRAALAFQD